MEHVSVPDEHVPCSMECVSYHAMEWNTSLFPTKTYLVPHGMCVISCNGMEHVSVPDESTVARTHRDAARTVDNTGCPAS